MSRALWWVMKGRAAAPPGMGCIIGVSTSRKPRPSKKRGCRPGWRPRRPEDLADLGVDDEVEVALAVAHLDVLQAVPLLRQRVEALGQEGERVAEHGQLAGAGLEHRPRERGRVAEVEQAEALVGLRPDGSPPDIGLEPAPAVGDMEEGRLAHLADGQDAAGHDDPWPRPRAPRPSGRRRRRQPATRSGSARRCTGKSDPRGGQLRYFSRRATSWSARRSRSWGLMASPSLSPAVPRRRGGSPPRGAGRPRPGRR